jgi:hypothetical protein
MKAPKLLPWIARKAGIPDELALKLWRRAAAEAEHAVGDAQSSDYFAALMDRFLTLVEAESGTSPLPQPEQTAWIWRYQRRMTAHSLTAAQSASRWWHNLARGMWPMMNTQRRAHCQ